MTKINYFIDYMVKNNLHECEGEYKSPPLQEIVQTDIPDSFISVLEKNITEIVEEHKLLAEAEIAHNKANGVDADDSYCKNRAQKNYEYWRSMQVTHDFKETLAKLNDTTNTYDEKTILDNRERVVLFYGDKEEIPNFGFSQAMRTDEIVRNSSRGVYMCWYSLKKSITEEIVTSIELRQFVRYINKLQFNYPNRELAELYIGSRRDPSDIIFEKSHQIVAFFMENLKLIAEGLTLLPNSSDDPKKNYFDTLKTINIMHNFDGVPCEFIPILLDFALGTNKTNRPYAQKLLIRLPHIHKHAIDGLSSKKQDVRVNAAEWLATIALDENHQQHHQEIVTAINACISKEKKEVVIASLLSSLEALGQDVSDFLTPENLLKEAEKGLKAKRSKQFEWFHIDPDMATLTWKNGDHVNPKIIEWWIILAEKLKEPAPNDLLKRYLELLSKHSQKTFSNYILATFISQDIKPYNYEQALEAAQKEAESIYLAYESYDIDFFWPSLPIRDTWLKKHTFAELSEEIIAKEIVTQLVKIPFSTAIKSKGMLALAHKADGGTAVATLQNYIKNHHKRTHQVTALITAFADSDDPAIIQFLLSIATRYRTKSIQGLAKNIIEETAKRNNWTEDELADRTIPTAGLDDNGIMTLEYGSRTLTASVDSKDKFVLHNEDGKVIKSLPAPRQNDDKDDIKEAKAFFSNAKKELKQLVPLQIARLHQAMCCAREWTVHDWQTYLFNHALMKRYISRLIWLEKDASGKTVQIFRPSDDGTLINVHDEEITINKQNKVQIAHNVVLDNATVKQWQQHLKDYEIKPLFEQLKHTAPQASENNTFNDFCGTPTETYKLKRVMTTLGYQHSGVGDGGGYTSYYKYYSNLNISAVLMFDGDGVNMENTPTSINDFCFKSGHVHTFDKDVVPILDVPPILVAESYAEYQKIAKAVTK